MTSKEYIHDKPICNVGTIGHIDHGKTTLTAAITKVLALRGYAEFQDYDQIAHADAKKFRRDETKIYTVVTSHVKYETDYRYYIHVDCPGHRDYIKNMITGAAQMDGAILVVDASQGPQPQTREHIVLAKQVGVPAVVIFLNKIDLIEDEEIIELVELELRELLDQYGFPGDQTPIVRGSAARALFSESLDANAPEYACIWELVSVIDEHIPQPAREVNKPFLLPIEDIHKITGRGTVVTGRVEAGRAYIGKQVEIVGLKETRETTITDIRLISQPLTEALPGDNVGLLLRGVDSKEVIVGQVVADPKSITPHQSFECTVYVLRKDEGGRHKPFFAGFRPLFFFRTLHVPGTVRLPDGVEMVMPGDNVTLVVELDAPAALEKGLRFAMRSSGKVPETVGTGIITNTLD